MFRDTNRGKIEVIVPSGSIHDHPLLAGLARGFLQPDLGNELVLRGRNLHRSHAGTVDFLNSMRLHRRLGMIFPDNEAFFSPATSSAMLRVSA